MRIMNGAIRCADHSVNSSQRLLLVEDTDADAEIVFHELRKVGLDFLTQRVETLPELHRALNEFAPDIILADYSLPGFGHETGMKALELARERLPDVPFVFFSGNIGEERAIQALRQRD